jgi:serine/threonine-protein kinase RsbW
LQKRAKTYRLRIPSQTDNLEIIREFVAKIAGKYGFDDDDISKIELAVDEACANVIKHAYGNDQHKPIDIVIKADERKLTVIVTDKGKGFDPRSMKAPDMKEYLAEMRVGGLGLYLMEALMDEVDFDIKPGKRNQVKLVKYVNKNDHAGDERSPERVERAR